MDDKSASKLSDPSAPVSGTNHNADEKPPPCVDIVPGTLKLLKTLAPPLQELPMANGQEPPLVYPPLSPAWSVAFSPDGKWLAASYGAPNPMVRLWQLQEDSVTWKYHSTLDGIHTRTIRKVVFAPLSSNNTMILAMASFDATVSIWECKPTSKTTTPGIQQETLQQVEWECTTQLEGHDNEVKDIAWNATATLLATCSRDKSVWVWETWLDGTVGGSSMNPFECLAVLTGSEADVKCIKFAPSHGQWGDADDILISAGYDDIIRIWAEDSGDWYCAMTLPTVHTDTIWSLAVAPGGVRVVSASADSSIAIWKHMTAAERQQRQKKDEQQQEPMVSERQGSFQCVGHLPNAHQNSTAIYSIDYAPAKAGHGRIVSAGADNRIQVYREVLSSRSDQPLFALDAMAPTNNDINCVQWHPWDGSLLCSAGDDGNVQLWRFDPTY